MPVGVLEVPPCALAGVLPCAPVVPVVPLPLALEEELAGGVVLAAGGGVGTVPLCVVLREIFLKSTPASFAASSSCTRREGTSAAAGTALPSRTRDA